MYPRFLIAITCNASNGRAGVIMPDSRKRYELMNWLYTGVEINSDRYCETLTRMVKNPSAMQAKMVMQSNAET